MIMDAYLQVYHRMMEWMDEIDENENLNKFCKSI